MPNNILDRYRVIAQLGRGGMADVFLTVTEGPLGFSKLLVVKVLHPELARTSEFLTMFRDEARLAARLNHPNVVQTYEAGESDGRHFIAMEYLEGQPLSRVIRKFSESNALTVGLVLRLGVDALSGLHYAHELSDFDGRPLGVVHRDVTPQNVFVSYEGQVKLVDFGIAKAFDSSTHTKVGTVKGKVSYMAPEQARGEPVDRTADIFSMGVLLWEMLAGARLWEGLTDIAVVGRLMQGDIPNLQSVRPELPASLAHLVMRALEPNPRDRPPTAEAFQRALQEELDHLAPRVTTRALGELMRAEFHEEREKVRSVVSKQLERALRKLPAEGSLGMASQLDMPLAGDMPLLGEGSSIHDALTTIHSGFTEEHFSIASSSSGTPHTPHTPTAMAHSERSLSTQRRNYIWPVLAALAFLALGAGAAELWKSTSQPEKHSSEQSSLDSELPRPETGQVARRSSEGQRGSDMRRSSEGQRSSDVPCGAKTKPVVELTGEIPDDAILTCDKDYLLRFTTYVSPGATLTIQPGTRILGDFETKGTLVVQPGARIDARGTPISPIVFTSASSSPHPGDWGGVILLGEAPVNLKSSSGTPLRGRIEGITAGGEYGGESPNDSSGVLSYVRIEYAGTELAPNNEINGLTLGGVGRGTVIDHVQVRHPADDCFEFFGGTVDAKYLVCQHPDDDAFDWDYGYTGRLQFLLAQADPKVSSGSNGFEGDNDPSGSENTPQSSPTVYNVTLCGKNRRLESAEHFGLLLRKGTELRLRNAIFMGFGAGLDVRDPHTKPDLAASVFFQNIVHNLAYPETTSQANTNKLLQDDDLGFNEVVYLENPGRRIAQMDPALGNCFDPHAPGFKPSAPLVSHAAIPPQDGFFDEAAQYVGAFRDRGDNWDAGAWLIWTD